MEHDILMQTLREEPRFVIETQNCAQNPNMARCAAEIIVYTQLNKELHENSELLKQACERYLEQYNHYTVTY